MILLNQILQGILLGGYYALIACGLSFMFSVMRIINLAHGDFAILGVFAVWLLVEQTGISPFLALAAAIVPPEETAAAHALLVSATQLAGNAAQIRREATLAGDMTRAWDASSAAAGALMLGAKARTDIQTSLRLPQLR